MKTSWRRFSRVSWFWPVTAVVRAAEPTISPPSSATFIARLASSAIWAA
jgi:hypothetical protein